VNAKGQIPFWDHGGDALPTDEQVRICPSIQERSGWVWSKIAFTASNWMFDTSFSISGRNTYGADGMVFWFTADKGSSGNMFGSTSSFTGMALAIDTFDNNGQGDTPRVSVFMGNGSFDYNHGTDGSGQDIGYCLKQIRNKRFPVQLKVIYIKNSLEVFINEGNTNSSENYDLCVKIPTVTLPPTGYFGISAATGGLSDDHDVMSFVVHSLTPVEQSRGKLMEDLDKAHADQLKEYMKFSETFESKQKKSKQPVKEDWENRLEMEGNVRMVYDMQASLLRELRALNDKISSLDGNDKVMAMEGRLSHHLEELKSHVRAVPAVGDGATASQQLQPIYEIRENVKKLNERVDRLFDNIQKGQGNGCPAVSCLSSGFFIVIILVQSLVVIGIILAKYAQERNAKKFF
jgi:mannose-binding lectin 1